MREKALALLREYNGSEALVKHGMQVEAIMRYYAREAGARNSPASRSEERRVGKEC